MNLPLFLLYNTLFGIYNVNLSSIAYCSEDIVKDKCDQLHINLISTFWNPDTSTFGYFGYDLKHDHHVLSFEGTQDVNDFIIDLQIAKLIPYKSHPTAKVHSGFWKAYKSISSELFPLLKGIDHLVITGHSLGAGISTICALDIVEELSIQNITITTFGSPRVGNNDYAELFNQNVPNSFRVTHGQDPVVHLPPVLLGFEHVSNEIYYPNNTLTYVECPKNDCAEKGFVNPWKRIDHAIYLGKKLVDCSI